MKIITYAVSTIIIDGTTKKTIYHEVKLFNKCNDGMFTYGLQDFKEQCHDNANEYANAHLEEHNNYKVKMKTSKIVNEINFSVETDGDEFEG